MSFELLSKKTKSEKVTLVTMEAEHLVKLFEDMGEGIFKRSVPFYVASVKIAGNQLTEVNSLNELLPGTYFHDLTAKTIYLRDLDNINPKFKEVSLVYRFFFSNAPLILPHDLNSGEAVEWLPLVSKIGNVGQQLSDESTGIVLESNSNIELINTEGFFDSYFDTLIWENKPVSFYIWFPESVLTEHRKIFEGVIDTKDFGADMVRFNVKDFVFRLRDKVKLSSFAETDGTLADSLLGSPKRRIYGQVKQAQLAGIDQVLKGFNLTGTVSIGLASKNLVGVGSNFLKELSPGDEIVIVLDGEEYKFGIDDVISNTLATLNKEAEENFIDLSVQVEPRVNYRFKNRRWHLAGHKLRETEAVIQYVISENRFIISSTQDLFAGDQILINNNLITIRRISLNEIITQNAVSPIPSVGTLLKKLPIQKVFFGKKELIYARDWTYQNTTEAIIQFNDLAEFNITQEKSLGVNLTFTNGSNTLTTTATVDFRAILKPRDWIRKNTTVSGQNTWHEILKVNEQSIILRSAYTGTTATTSALIKAVEYMGDDALITANALGFEENGEWLKTPSDMVRHLILNDAGFSQVNEASFSQAKADCDYITSMVIPERIGEDAPMIRDVITKMNESVFGSLYGDSSLNISYAILNAVKPDIKDVIRDDDILSFDTQSKTEIYNNIICSYRPFVDLSNGQDTFEIESYNSGFVDKHIGLKNTLTRTLYIYEQDKAETIAQRLALFYSMANTKLSIKGKMNFFLNAVNDKLFVSFDRLFKRFGGNDRRKFGVITSIKKGQTEVDLEMMDLGNIFNRIGAIAPNDAHEFSEASGDERLKFGYVVDNDTLTPDVSKEDGISCNLIG